MKKVMQEYGGVIIATFCVIATFALVNIARDAYKGFGETLLYNLLHH